MLRILTFRSDFVGQILTEQSLVEARAAFVPILYRLSQSSFEPLREERAEMLALRMAFSRDSAIEGQLDPLVTHVVSYPVLRFPQKSQRVELERLAFLGLLRRRHFIRTHSCDHCKSNRLMAFEACHNCGSSDLVDEAIVHHYRCGCQEPESHFVHGADVVCPKCHRQLKHFGMDYGKPGLIVHCLSCGKNSPDPLPRFVCLDCKSTCDSQQVQTIDWFHYDLTTAAVRALSDGRLPGDVMRIRQDGKDAGRSLREFKALATAALRTAQRFGRPFSLARLMVTNFGLLAAQCNVADVSVSLYNLRELVAKNLTECDFVAVGHKALLVGLPEIDAADAAPLIKKLQEGLVPHLSIPFDFEAMICDGPAALQLLSEY